MFPRIEQGKEVPCLSRQIHVLDEILNEADRFVARDKIPQITVFPDRGLQGKRLMSHV